MKASALTCAIYTRKSSEEGLEQGFNSLDAQREACEAYVLSQRHEGWKVLKERYDDGGYSGGTMERPALKRLLEDIDRRRVNVVVVYKVDRLTRSLADFAKIVERFDAQGVSFVSITQQFNTTSSMGRLTLNVLLSFAQFEREVTGERIRDKIAASKQKGMWMGGTPPIGYRGNERTLKIDEDSAQLVRHLYARYLELGTVWKLKQELDMQHILTPKRLSNAGNAYGGQPFSRGQLYRILTDPVYLGEIRHRGQRYPGQHPPILEQASWEAVQARMQSNRQGSRSRNTLPSMSLLTGILFDAQGNRLVPSNSQKQARRYRYYLSEPLTRSGREHAREGLRIPAQELEGLVRQSLRDWLTDTHALLEYLRPEPGAIEAVTQRASQLAQALEGENEQQYAVMRQLVCRVVLETDSVEIRLQGEALLAEGSTAPQVHLSVPVKVRRCGHSMRLLIPGPQEHRRQGRDARLILAIARGHDWLGQLTSGRVRSIGEIAAREGIVNTQVTRTLYRAFLAPDIVRMILDGNQPAHLTLEFLKQHLPLPVDWHEQRRVLGLVQQ